MQNYTKKLTPLMRQYWQIKSQHQDKILFFRMGDFFEMFHEDAEKASPVLNIALTMRNKKASDQTKMCGVPHHSIAGPISKLLSHGFKVAICDQVEPTPQAKGLVKRAVTRILTPGMVYDPESLDRLSAHYICAFDALSVSFLDSSTGEAFFYPLDTKQNQEHIIHLLHPVELVLTSKQKEQAFLKKEWQNIHLTVFDHPVLSHSSTPLTPIEAGRTCPEGSALIRGESGSSGPKVETATPLSLIRGESDSAGYQSGDGSQALVSQAELTVSAKRLLAYVHSTQGEGALKIIQPFQKKFIDREIEFSRQAHEHLELFKNYTNDKAGSLFSAINRTKTPPGARLLKARLRAPSTDKQEIEKRLNWVEKWVKSPSQTEKVRTLLSQIGDIERKIGKISHPQCHGRDILSLAESLDIALKLVAVPQVSSEVHSLFDINTLHSLVQEIFRTIRADAPASIQNGLMIQKGVSEELDSLITETEKKQSSLRRMEERERLQTGIPSLKIRYNNVFGYYIEVTKIHAKKIPSHYIRKQTLTQAERYTTEKLQTIEGHILSARGRRIAWELKIFENLRQKILHFLPELFCLSRAVCEMDLQTGLAFLAVEQSYTRPRFASDNQLSLVNSRHPVVEQKQSRYFVPNTIRLKNGECLLLTGPNMAGKSTLMRQVALSAIMAQAGSFVPAEQALLPLFRKLFTRIGASDSLSEGLSTFMVEMKESAEILKKADGYSLVILDEIGRGTATYDGMSLAQAIVEHLVQDKKSLVFFATHYHELTALSQSLPCVRNAHLSVSEKDGKIEFLYTLVSGALAQSYGVHVAKLAGFPLPVVQRAEALLQKREKQGQGFSPLLFKDLTHPNADQKDRGLGPNGALSSGEGDFRHLIEQIRGWPLQEKSPLETLSAVESWKKNLME